MFINHVAIRPHFCVTGLISNMEKGVSSRLPDVADVTNSGQVGKAIAEFVRTIPGVSTDKSMLETVSRPESIALSSQAVSALLRRDRGGEVGMGLTFAYEGWPKHKLYFERLDASHDRVAVCLEIGLDSVPIGGKIEIGRKEHGQFIFNKDLIKFDSNGIALEGVPGYDLRRGEKLDIIQMIQQITSPNDLGNPVNADKMIAKAKSLKIKK
jgi:hypothetical protein